MGSYRNKHSKEYDEYLRSESWQRKRQLRLEIDGHKCVMCNRPASKCRSGLIAHHIRYTRNGESILGKEDVMKDLCTLCSPCHTKIHNYYRRRQ